MYPEAAILRTITVGGSFTLEAGETLSIKAEILASRGLMWGGVLYPRFAESMSTVGGPAQFEIPTTRQAQWRTLNNEIIDLSDPEAHTHYYTLHIRVETTSGQFVYEKTYHFPLEEGDGSPVDIDQLIEAGIVEGRIISVPDRWSELVAQAVAAAGSADAAEAFALSAGEDAAVAGQARIDAEQARTTTLAAQSVVVAAEAAVGEDRAAVTILAAQAASAAGGAVVSAGESEASRAAAVAAQVGSEAARDLAAGSASFAQGYAASAGQSASTAETHATTASQQAALATTARQGAETAQGLAEDARDAAQAASAVTVTTGAVVGDDLILTRTDATTVNAGSVRGPQGDKGDKGDKGDIGPAGPAVAAGGIRQEHIYGATAQNLWNPAAQVAPNIIGNTYLDPSGNLAASTSYFVSSKIPVQASAQYTMSGFWGTAGAGYRGAYYTSADTWISPISDTAGTFTTPATAAYIRLTVVKSYALATGMIVPGPSLPGSFVPYGAEVPWLKTSPGAVRTAELAEASVTTSKMAEASVTTSKMAPSSVESHIVSDEAILPAHISGAVNGNFFDIARETAENVAMGAIYSSTGVLQTYAGYHVSAPVPILPGIEYSCNASWTTNSYGVRSVYRINFFTATGQHAGTSIEVNAQNLTSATFTSPATAAYMRLTMNGTIPGERLGKFMLVRGNTLPADYLSYGVEVTWLRQPGFLANRFAGKRALFIGDSITRGYSPGIAYTDPPVVDGGQITPTFTELVGQYLGMATIRRGYDGATAIAGESTRVRWADDWATRLADVPEVDYIGILLGANDGQGAVGTTADTTNATYCGAMKNLIAGLLGKYPNAWVFAMTPTYQYPLLVQAVKDVCTYMKVPYLNLHHGDGMRATYTGNSTVIPELVTEFFGHNHPNQNGHRRLAEKISGFISAGLPVP